MGKYSDYISKISFSNFPSRIRDVGVLFDLSIHDVDIVVLYLLGETPEFVLANGGKAKNDIHEDHVALPQVS